MEEGDARGIGRAAAFVCDDSTRVVSTGDTLSQVATPGCDTERRRAHRALTETHASGGAYEKNKGASVLPVVRLGGREIRHLPVQRGARDAKGARRGGDVAAILRERCGDRLGGDVL